MNPTIETLQNHRSIRQFEKQPVSPTDLETALACGQRASTSSNIQAYSILRITDAAKRHQLVELTCDQQFVEDAGAFFIICGDLRRHRLLAERAGHAFNPTLEAFLLATIDASLFAQNFAAAFESLGYGICFVGGLRTHLVQVNKLLNLPRGVLPLYGLAVGTPENTSDLKPRLNPTAICFDDVYPDDESVLSEIDQYDNICREYYEDRTGKPRDWSTVMSRKFSSPSRAYLAEYYRSQGASFD